MTPARSTRPPTSTTTATPRPSARSVDLHLVLPALVVAEATSFVGRRLGAQAEAVFVRGLAPLDVEAPTEGDMAELVEEYADFPLGGTDASLVALAERLDAPLSSRSTAGTSPRCVPATARPSSCFRRNAQVMRA